MSGTGENKKECIRENEESNRCALSLMLEKNKGFSM